MPLVDREIAFGIVPGPAIFRVVEHRLAPVCSGGDRTVGNGLSFEVAPRARDGVVAAEIESRARAVLRLQAQAGVLAVEKTVVVVGDERQIVRASAYACRRERPRVDRLTGRDVRALG